MSKPILRVENINKSFQQQGSLLRHFMRDKPTLKAVDNVSFDVYKGQTLGLVGESGSGKTTIGKAILNLLSVDRGKVFYDDIELTALSARQMRPYRRSIQMIFQDLDAALNPKLRIRHLLSEAIYVHDRHISKQQCINRTHELLDLVHLTTDKLNCYPTELSGGEKRRIGIARVLAVEPKLIVADEPTSALDVSIQAQVINLLKELQQKLNLTYIFISHDLPLVELISHQVAVMYKGKIVEMGDAMQVSEAPRHPYTALLWSSLTVENTSVSPADDSLLVDETMSQAPPTTGCSFAPRCQVFKAKNQPMICLSSDLSLKMDGDNTQAHRVACHFPLNRDNDTHDAKNHKPNEYYMRSA